MQTKIMNTDTAVKDVSRTIIDRHLNFFQENDLEALTADYTNESVLITEDLCFTGVEEIKGFFAELIPHFPKNKSTFKLDKMVIENNLVYIVWHGKTPSLEVPFATDTFVIKNGKILWQTFAGQLKFSV